MRTPSPATKNRTTIAERRSEWRALLQAAATLLVLLLAAATLLALLLAGHGHGQAGWELRVCSQADNLPYSDERGQGYEDRIAQILAEELGASLTHVRLANPGGRAFEQAVREGACDLVMGVNDGNQAFDTTHAYYRSTYVFVFREDEGVDVSSLDSPELRDLRIGVQASGRSASPVTLALARRDLLENQVILEPTRTAADPLPAPLAAVADGTVDVAVVWGPVAGYFSALSSVALEVVPVIPQIDAPFLPLVSSISMGVRPGDESLRRRLDQALAQRWDDIQEVLEAYRVPRLDLPAPHGAGQ